MLEFTLVLVAVQVGLAATGAATTVVPVDVRILQREIRRANDGGRSVVTTDSAGWEVPMRSGPGGPTVRLSS